MTGRPGGSPQCVDYEPDRQFSYHKCSQMFMVRSNFESHAAIRLEIFARNFNSASDLEYAAKICGLAKKLPTA